MNTGRETGDSKQIRAMSTETDWGIEARTRSADPLALADGALGFLAAPFYRRAKLPFYR
jgi:hypothetical protein